jgi:hypothetical protein
VERVELGMTQKEVLAALPTGPGITRRNTPGEMVNFMGQAPTTATHVIRQLFVRYNNDERVVELRGRYAQGPAAKGNAWQKEILNELMKRGGLPEELPAPWVKVWDDLPPQSPAPAFYRWQDDATVRTFQRDADTVEVVLRDCPPGYADGVPLTPLRYLPRGPEGCLLGTKRDELLKNWRVTKPVMAEDALVLSPASGPYDGLLVWFDKDNEVTRVAAQHRARPEPTRLPDSLAQAWGREIKNYEVDTFGWPLRQDFGKRGREGLAWHDDVTRFRIFWQEQGTRPPRMYTAWKDITAAR